VTLLQLAAAYLCVANDGAYVRPYLIESVRQPLASSPGLRGSSGRVVRRLASGAPVRQFHPARLRQALEPTNARLIKDILEQAVAEGTGVLAQIDGVTVCGKTGTAQKVEPGVGYSRTKSRMTFVGFFPKERPRYVIAVLIDEPKTDRFASTVACPVFRQIGENLILLERMKQRIQRTGDFRTPLSGTRPPESSRCRTGAAAASPGVLLKPETTDEHGWTQIRASVLSGSLCVSVVDHSSNL
jgi:cell division protein FtsI (penicillin-binding protein 3)